MEVLEPVIMVRHMEFLKRESNHNILCPPYFFRMRNIGQIQLTFEFK